MVHPNAQVPHFVHLWISFSLVINAPRLKNEIITPRGQTIHHNLRTKKLIKKNKRNIQPKKVKVVEIIEPKLYQHGVTPPNKGNNTLAGQTWQKGKKNSSLNLVFAKPGSAIIIDKSKIKAKNTYLNLTNHSLILFGSSI
jgi:hypothetical protein